MFYNFTGSSFTMSLYQFTQHLTVWVIMMIIIIIIIVVIMIIMLTMSV